MRNRRLASSGLRLSRQPRDRPHQLRGVRRQAHGRQDRSLAQTGSCRSGSPTGCSPTITSRSPTNTAARPGDGLPSLFFPQIAESAPRSTCNTGGGSVYRPACGSGGSTARESQSEAAPEGDRRGLFRAQATRESRHGRRPRTAFSFPERAGNGRSPHGRRAPFRHPVGRDRYARELGSVAQAADTSEALATLPGAALLPPTLRRSCSLRSRATGRFREPALRIDPEPPQLARRSQLSHRPQFALAL